MPTIRILALKTFRSDEREVKSDETRSLQPAEALQRMERREADPFIDSEYYPDIPETPLSLKKSYRMHVVGHPAMQAAAKALGAKLRGQGKFRVRDYMKPPRWGRLNSLSLQQGWHDSPAADVDANLAMLCLHFIHHAAMHSWLARFGRDEYELIGVGESRIEEHKEISINARWVMDRYAIINPNKWEIHEELDEKLERRFSRVRVKAGKARRRLQRGSTGAQRRFQKYLEKLLRDQPDKKPFVNLKPATLRCWWESELRNEFEKLTWRMCEEVWNRVVPKEHPDDPKEKHTWRKPSGRPPAPPNK